MFDEIPLRKIMMFGESVVEMGSGSTVDRISELPEFILHNIILNLDTKEAGRVSVLSKRWYGAWSSVPVLNFRLEDYKKEYWDCSLKYCFTFDDDVIQSFLGFIDRTVNRYDTQKYRIRRLDLELPTGDKKIEPLVDRWIRIAVQNQVEELSIDTIPSYSSGYRLPEILFRAKSLKVLECHNIVLPYYKTIELISLEYLTLDQEIVDSVDMDLLQGIMSLCPLVEFSTTVDLEKISLPWERKVNKRAEFLGTEIMQSEFKASPLRKFQYNGIGRDVKWPLNMNLIALKNLRELEIGNATITDGIVSELLNGLVALERLLLLSCSMLKCIVISSISLKKLEIVESYDLIKVTIDAPNLIEFWYNCEVETSLSLIKVFENCNAQLSPWVSTMECSITTDWLVKVKKILEETSLFQSLVIEFPGYLMIDVEEDQLRNVDIGSPYKLRELKLTERNAWHSVDSEESPVMALDGLFWICHPDELSITTSVEDLTAEAILDFLKCKIQCWKHPLKSIDVEGIDSSRLLSHIPQNNFKFRLSWLEV